ncbi:MAG: CHAP domain-containing protein [Anaerolineae bacterium]
MTYKRLYRAIALFCAALLLFGAAGHPDDSAWTVYHSARWGYSLAHPAAWHAEVTLRNADDQPLSVLRERLVISGAADAQVLVEVWTKAPAQGLLEWVAAVQGDLITLSGITLPKAANARIAGREALLLSQPGGCGGPPLLMAYIDAGDRVLLVLYAVRDDGASLEVYRALLASLIISPELQTGGEARLVLPSFQPQTNAYDPCDYAPNEQGCCGYPRVPHWQCSLDLATKQHRGNCTYWAAYKRPDIAAAVAWGNGGQWASRAQSVGCWVDTIPRVGDLMVREYSPGHVAYVTAVHATTIDITEMAWCTSCPQNTRNVPIAGRRYIHVCPGFCAFPELTSPASGAVYATRIASFSWLAPACNPASYELRIRTLPDMQVGGETAFAGQTTLTQLSVQLEARWDNVTLYWSARAAPSGAWSPARILRIEPVPQTLTFFPLIQVEGE